jgi:hypothetical protein
MPIAVVPFALTFNLMRQVPEEGKGYLDTIFL